MAERCGAGQHNLFKTTRGAIGLNSETKSHQREKHSLWLDGRRQRFPDLGLHILHVINLERVHIRLADGVCRSMLSLASASQLVH
jgi:hypothetical protein